MLSASAVGRTDIYEKDGNVIYEMELPGVTRDGVEVKIDQGRLTVTGEIKSTDDVKREDYFRIGRRHGRFRRSFPLPPGVKNESSVSARLEHGVLKALVPLDESIKERPTAVEVKVESRDRGTQMREYSAVERLRLRIAKSLDRARTRRRRAEERRTQPKSWREMT